MKTSKCERPRIDYSYRLTEQKPSESPKNFKSNPNNHMFLSVRSSDPIVQNIRRSMKRHSRVLNQAFDIFW